MSQYRIIQNELGDYGIEKSDNGGKGWRQVAVEYSRFSSYDWTGDLSKARASKAQWERWDETERKRNTVRVIE